MWMLVVFAAGGMFIELTAARKASRRTGRSVFASAIVDAWSESLLGVKVPILAGLWLVVSMLLGVVAASACTPKSEGTGGSPPASVPPQPVAVSKPDVSAPSSSIKEFSAQFREAVLSKDVAWVSAKMDPDGWACGDAEMAAKAYADALKRGEMDFELLFGGPSIRARNELSYREWFERCSSAHAVEQRDYSGVAEEAFLVRWEGSGCPEDGPAMGVVRRGASLAIRVFGGCL